MELTKNDLIGLIQYTSGEMKEDLIDVTEQDAEIILNKYLEAINYKHCSEQLKDGTILPFNKWMEVNKYTKMFIYYKKDSAVFSFREVLDKYISYTNSF